MTMHRGHITGARDIYNNERGSRALRSLYVDCNIKYCKHVLNHTLDQIILTFDCHQSVMQNPHFRA